MDRKLNRLKKEQIQEIAQKYGLTSKQQKTKKELIVSILRDVNPFDLNIKINKILPIPKGKKVKFLSIPVILPQEEEEISLEEEEEISLEEERIQHIPCFSCRLPSSIEEEEISEETPELMGDCFEEFEGKDEIEIYSNHPGLNCGSIEEVVFCEDECDLRYNPSIANIYLRYHPKASKTTIVTSIDEILKNKDRFTQISIIYMLPEIDSMFEFETEYFNVQSP